MCYTDNFNDYDNYREDYESENYGAVEVKPTSDEYIKQIIEDKTEEYWDAFVKSTKRLSEIIDKMPAQDFKMLRKYLSLDKNWDIVGAILNGYTRNDNEFLRLEVERLTILNDLMLLDRNDIVSGSDFMDMVYRALDMVYDLRQK